jgi:hypothetical protein
VLEAAEVAEQLLAEPQAMAAEQAEPEALLGHLAQPTQAAAAALHIMAAPSAQPAMEDLAYLLSDTLDLKPQRAER